jgi:hypothetical protein
MSIDQRPGRGAGAAAAIGGLIITGLGVVATSSSDAVGGAWFVTGGLAALLLAVGVLGLRGALAGLPVARGALAFAAVALTAFGLAHLYSLVDEDLAILLFSVFMVLASIGLVVAGVALLRSGVGDTRTRWLPLACGVWPVATIPAGAAIGDVPHFLAITVWGLLWVALGIGLVTAGRDRVPAI